MINSVSTIIKSLQNKFCRVLNLDSIKETIEVNLKKLPSIGLFYPDDLKMRIKKASDEDVSEYNSKMSSNSPEDISELISQIKLIVKNNTSFNKNYKFEDIRSIDVIYIFLMIVKYTKNKDILIPYYDTISNSTEIIKFNQNTFNYFDTSKLMKYYNDTEKVFEINDYKYSIPTIGIENSLTNFMIFKLSNGESEYENKFYGFTHFCGMKNKLSFEELENLIQIFNEDIDENELKTIKGIIKTFEPMQTYTLLKNDIQIDLNSKLDLFKIWD